MAAYNGEALVIQSMEAVSGLFGTWRKPLEQECKKNAESGFIVLVEERGTAFFSQYGSQVLFDDIDPEEKRTYQNIAFDLYYSLTAMGDTSGNRHGNLVVASGLERHLLTGNVVNVEQDEKGRNRYDIEPDRFSGYHRSMLLAVLAAQFFNPPTDEYLQEFFKYIGGTPDKPKPLRTIEAVIASRNANGGFQ
ncbi:hypothetical protein [Endozoicomonas lisbonensis]